MFGYKDVRESQLDCDLEGAMDKIKVPSFYLNAKDDFLMGSFNFTMNEIKQNEYLMHGTVERGGHSCYYEPSGFGGLIPKQWFTKPAGSYLRFAKRYYND